MIQTRSGVSTDGAVTVMSGLPAPAAARSATGSRPKSTPDVDAADPSAPLPERFQRQTVAYNTHEAPGTIIVDTPNTYLYYVLGGGMAIRYLRPRRDIQRI